MESAEYMEGADYGTGMVEHRHLVREKARGAVDQCAAEVRTHTRL